MVNQATGISGVEARPYERAARVDVAEQRDVRDVDQSSRVDLLAFLQQDDTAASLRNPASRSRCVERLSWRGARHEAARRVLLALPEGVDLVGQADPDQRAARALRAVDERRRGLVARRICTQILEGRESLLDEIVVDGDVMAGAGLSEVDFGVVDLIPGLPQQQDLSAELRELGLPERLFLGARTAALVLDRNDGGVARLEEIDLGDQAELLGGEVDRRARGARVFLFGLGRRASLVVHTTVDERAMSGVGVVLEALVDPLQVREARAVDVLVEDAGGDEGWGAHCATCCPQRYTATMVLSSTARAL
jgi:hypothetical protein